MTEAAGDQHRAPDLGLAIARLLTIGTSASVLLVGAGLAAMLFRAISPLDPSPALEPGALPDQLLALDPAGLLWLGILVVIITPTARVLAALVGYARRQEREMVAVSAGILVVVTLGVILARLAEG